MSEILDADTFKGKVFLNIIDKLVLGVIAAVIVSIIQCQSQEYQKLKELTFEVTKVQTEFLVEQRQNLSNAVSDYISLVGCGEVLSSGKIKAQEDKKKLSSLLDKIRISVFHMRAINDDLDKAGRTLVESASNLNVSVLSGRCSTDIIEEKMNTLRGSYSNVLIKIREATKEIIRKEYKG